MNTTFTVRIIAMVLFFCNVSQAQVPGYVPLAGLQAWLGMSGNANDASGNGNNATNSGATFIADRNGNPGEAASFNGTSNYMEISTPTFQFSPTGAFSYSFWMNKQTQVNGAGIAMMSGTGTTGVFITLIQGASNFTFGTNKQQSSWFFINCAHTFNVWDHYVTTYNAGVMKLFKNGLLQSTTTYTHAGASTATIPFMIGRGLGGNSTCFKGTLDDIGIWNRELSQSEINNLFSGITSLAENENEVSLQVYPNPAKELITLSSSVKHIGSNFQITDIQGRVVETGKISNQLVNIDIKSLPSGSYFIHVGEQNKLSFKFLKE